MRKKLMLIAIMFAMAGCPQEPQIPQSQINEDRLQREKEQRIQAEASRDKEKAGKEQWQGFTAIAVVGAIILLIAGAMLGSRTKHHAQHHE